MFHVEQRLKTTTMVGLKPETKSLATISPP